MPDNLGIFNILIVMPNLRNAKKALRQTKKRALRNKTIKTAYKSATKAVKKAVVAGEEMGDKIVFAQKKLDKAAKAGIIKKKTASRKLSRLMKSVNRAKTK